MTTRSEGTHRPSRRDVLAVGAAAAPFMILPRRVLGGTGQKAPSDTLNIAGIGIGGMGANYLQRLTTQNIMALCDVDDNWAAPTFRKYPSAKRYHDFRVLLDQEKGVDAVVIGTPDHSHALIAMAAMQLGKHVYCAKPMARTIGEVRAMVRTARDAKVATQMSVQTCASERACQTAEWIQAGAIGAVREVHVWNDRPIWPQALARPAETPAPPATLDWDLWLGPAPYRPYHPAYLPFTWRGWWDFGSGALGDMGCHTMHVIVRALSLRHPASVHASSSALVRGSLVRNAEGIARDPERVAFPETAPAASIVTWSFPARGDLAPVRVTWYDGGLKPPRPEQLEPDRELEKDGILFVGEQGVLLSKFTGGPELAPRSRMTDFHPPKPTLPRVKNHYQEWVDACKGGPPASCEFEFGGFLTELVAIGNIAVRTNRRLEWDGEAGRFRKDEEANRYLSEPYRKGWHI